MTAPPTNKGRKFHAEPLTADEARELIHAMSSTCPTGIRNRAATAAMYGAGLRVSEMLTLQPSNVDVDAASIRILRGKGRKARTVGIDEGALIHIVRWVETRKALGIRGRILMCTLDGGPMQARYVRAMLNRAAEKSGLEKRVHPHGMRHTHAAELESSGFTVSEIQQQLGHSNLATTATYLNHVSPSARVNKIRNRRAEL